MSEDGESDNPSRSLLQYPLQRIAPFRPDRFMNLVLGKEQQRGVTNLLKKLREENIYNAQLQVEIMVSIRIEDFARNLVERNRDLIRRIWNNMD